MGSTVGHGLYRVPFPMCYGIELTSRAVLEWTNRIGVVWHYI